MRSKHRSSCLSIWHLHGVIFVYQVLLSLNNKECYSSNNVLRTHATKLEYRWYQVQSRHETKKAFLLSLGNNPVSIMAIIWFPDHGQLFTTNILPATSRRSITQEHSLSKNYRIRYLCSNIHFEAPKYEHA